MSKVKVLLFYRDFLKVGPGFCHAGLGVNAFHTKEVLERNEVNVLTFGVVDSNELDKHLHVNRDAKVAIIEAPVWVWITKLDELSKKYPNIQFLVRLHSQIAFLTAEPSAIKALRDVLELSKTRKNVNLASNSRHIKNWVETVFHEVCVYLPNLYDLDIPASRKQKKHGPLMIGSFGSLRFAKNHTTAAAAAQMLASKRDQELLFHVNVNREEHGKGVLSSLHNMFDGLPRATLVECEWADWKSFRKLVGSMDLNFQVSTTETFNIVSADSVAEGVPVVVSPVIEWAPDHWKSETDDLEKMVRIGNDLLDNHHDRNEGRIALGEYLQKSTIKWLDYLGV